jgi:peptide/nickel transport system substrate-binding protein
MESKRQINRREFLRVSALAAAGAVLASCAKQTEAIVADTKVPVVPTEALPPTATEKPAVKPTDAPTATPLPPPPAYTESPMLAAMVTAGTLPPVEERLPENPMVFPVLEMVGKHGGIARRGFKGVSDRWGPTKLGDRGFAWFDKNLVNRPRFCESWTVNADGSEWVFKMRKGTKWSDGTPWSTADTVWWYENIVLNKTLSPTIGTNYSTGPEKTPMTVEAPDEETIVIKFAAANPLFLLKMGRDIMCAPPHYLKQWHMDLTDDKDALTKAFTDAGFASWDLYFLNDRNRFDLNPDLPTLRPFNAKNTLAQELFQMERNAYFWGVDEAGNQLPYWDGINHRLFETNDVFNLWIVNGEIDFQARHVDSAQYTLYKENEASGDYKVFVGVSAGHMAIQLNLATKNEKLWTFFNNRDVRIGLSYAIDREMINELIYNGLATPRQYSPLPMSPQYYPKLSNAYLDYDVTKANQLLDDAGYSAKDADGFRTYPDGETISFTIEGTDQAGTPAEDGIQQIIKMWEAVGVKCAYKYYERALYSEHYAANEIEAASWGGDRTVIPLSPSAIIFRGTQPDRPWAAGYGNWYNTPTAGGAVEPPADHFIWKIWEIWDKVAVEADPDKQNALFFQILDIWAEELPMISVLGELPSFCIVKNGVHNFLEGFPNDDTTGDENVYNTETYTWDEPEKHTG